MQFNFAMRGDTTTAVKFERWNYNNTEVFTIKCVNNDGLYSLVETFDVYNDVFNKPR